MRIKVTFGLLLLCALVSAQSLEEKYKAFQQSAKNSYADFRDAANEKYASFLRSSWEYYKILPAVKPPKEEPVPPVVYEEPEVKPEPQPIPQEDVTPVLSPDEQPEPIAPVVENDESSSTISISFYGTDMEFRHPSVHRLSLSGVSGEALEKAWLSLSDSRYDNLIFDCLKAREKYQLCDWAYYQMTKKLAEKIYGAKNEAVLLQAFIFAQSGYAMRLAMSKESGRLCMLVGSQYKLYDFGYYYIDGLCYYPLMDVSESLSVCTGAFEHESPVSLLFGFDQKLAHDDFSTKSRRSSMGVNASCTVNRNQISFYNDYPTGQIGDEFWTRWLVYANSPVEESVRNSLYPALSSSVRGVPEKQAVSKILNWVQTGFEYQYDDSVWGRDRAFFPSESLYYPYADCEDRAILFSRIVRDLLNLDVALIYYPGHLAAAVCFNQDVAGDFVTLNDKRYVICDPTYIGAPIGATMPDMNNKTAIVIPLQR